MVELANIKSPSKGRWDGTIARAIPSCADVASLLACAFVKLASVATMPIVVLARSSSGNNSGLLNDFA